MQNKIFHFFEKSTIGNSLVHFEFIKNELDVIRYNLFQVKEDSKSISINLVIRLDTIVNPPKKPMLTPLRGKGSMLKNLSNDYYNYYNLRGNDCKGKGRQ